MQEQYRYATGIDIGATTVRCVVGHIDDKSGNITVVGVGESPNSGMRKGVVVNLNGPAEAIDKALGEAERMSGYEIDTATININGSHIMSSKVDGMIAIGSNDSQVSPTDIARIEDVAIVGKVPANRTTLEVIPHSFSLDSQDNIKDPIGMSGTRLEMKANVVSALAPNVGNLRKISEMANVKPSNIVPSAIAAARAVLSERQLENGVAVVDFGATTTGIAVYEEGDLQYTGVIPLGSNHITNDLAIGLQIDPEIAEQVKLQSSSIGLASGGMVHIEYDGKQYEFSQDTVNEITEARSEEIIEAIQEELKRSGYDGKLPSGLVIVGGGAHLNGLAEMFKKQLELAVKIGKPVGLSGVCEQIEGPQYTTVVGLMMADLEKPLTDDRRKEKNTNNKGGILARFFAKIKQ